jgi:hypothetical protein
LAARTYAQASAKRMAVGKGLMFHCERLQWNVAVGIITKGTLALKDFDFELVRWMREF